MSSKYNIKALFINRAFIFVILKLYFLFIFSYSTYKTTAVNIPSKLQAKASLGKCQSDSLNFSQSSLFIALAWSHASNLTFIAS